MGRRRRTTVEPGIYRDTYGFTIRIHVRGGPIEGDRFPRGTSIETLRAARTALEREHQRMPPTSSRGSLAADVAAHLATLAHGRSKQTSESLLDHWLNAPWIEDGIQIGTWKQRATESLEPKEISAQLARFGAEQKRGRARFSKKTLNELRRLLGSVFITKNGKRGANPVRDVKRERVLYDDPRGFSYGLIEFVLRQMPDRGHPIKGHDRPTVNLTKLRLRAMAYTGLHQRELGRLTARDLRDLSAKRVWVQGRQKGAGTAGVWQPLTTVGVEALEALVRANALGPFGTRSMSTSWNVAVRHAQAAWREQHPTKPWPLPENVRPYDLRHSYGTAVYQQTGDIRAAQRLLRHATIATTLRYTAAAVDERAMAAARALEAVHGRGATTVPRSGSRMPQNSPPTPISDAGDGTRKIRRRSGKAAKV